jgi:hypothetical protein
MAYFVEYCNFSHCLKFRWVLSEQPFKVFHLFIGPAKRTLIAGEHLLELESPSLRSREENKTLGLALDLDSDTNYEHTFYK